MTYPDPLAETDTLATTLFVIVTVAWAPVPFPVMLYNGTAPKEPLEYPIPALVIAVDDIAAPFCSIIPVGPVVAPSLTFLPIVKFALFVASILTFNFRGNVVIEFGNNLAVWAFLFPSFGL